MATGQLVALMEVTTQKLQVTHQVKLKLIELM